MFKDFRDYLDQLEKKGKLLRVKKEVDVRFDIAAGIRKISDHDGPALLFENIKGFPNWRVAGGLYATKKLMALALETEEDKILARYLECDQKRVKPKLVSTGPVKEIILKGEEIDLTKLPIPTYSEKDAGPYLTSGVEIAKHPETGIPNVSIHRRTLLGKDRTTLLAAPVQHLGMMIAAAEEKGQGLGVATVIGADPSLSLASQIRSPMGVDETEIAGALRGAPLEMVKCETIDVEVPAYAEIVIEGVTMPGERALDGPFGEVPGNYITMTGILGVEDWVVKVTAITMRKNPIFQATLTGMPMTENHWMKKWALAAAAYRVVESVVTYADDIKGVNVTDGGAASYHVVVSVRKRSEMDARRIMNALFAARGIPMHVVVVDDDIDVFDPVQVEWAVATRMQPDKDIIILPPVSHGPGEFQAARALGSKWGIDATMPLKDRDWYRRICVPGVEKVDYV